MKKDTVLHLQIHYFTVLFLYYFFAVMILDENKEPVKAQTLGNIVVK